MREKNQLCVFTGIYARVVAFMRHYKDLCANLDVYA